MSPLAVIPLLLLLAGDPTPKCGLNPSFANEGVGLARLAMLWLEPGGCHVTISEQGTWQGQPIDQYFYEARDVNSLPQFAGQQVWNRILRVPSAGYPDQSRVERWHVRRVPKGKKGKELEDLEERIEFELLAIAVPKRIEVSPGRVAPGAQVDLVAEYVVRDAPAGVSVAEKREVLFGERAVVSTEDVVQRANGTHVSTKPLRIPASAPPGPYTLRVKLETPRTEASASATFEVR